MNKLLSMGILSLLSLACRPTDRNSSNVQEVTGRLSMGARDPFQCYNLSYSGDEQVNGKWVAGADGTTFGSMKDGEITGQCGRTFTIRNKKTGASAEFILVDRIWENDGVNGRRYNNKGNADAKRGDIGPGYEQLDIAVAPFKSLFGGHNPAASDVEIIGLGSGSGSLTTGRKETGAGDASKSPPPSSAPAALPTPTAATGKAGNAANGYPYCTNGSDTGDGFGWDESVRDPNGKHSCVVPGGGADVSTTVSPSVATVPSTPTSASDSSGSPAQPTPNTAVTYAANGYPYCTNGSNTGDGYGWDESVTDPNGSHSCMVP